MGYALERLVVGDNPDSWRAAGFTVHGSLMRFGKVTVELVGSDGPRGVLGWKLRGISTDIDGLVTQPDTSVEVLEAIPEPSGVNEHTNAVFGIDHVVIETGDIERTVGAFEGAGMKERRSAVMETPAGERRQSFLWAGRVILEIIGPMSPKSEKETMIWGLALVTGNLQTTSHVLEEKLSEPRDAVQPGRKIATMKTADLDISVPIVIMSPHVAELL